MKRDTARAEVECVAASAGVVKEIKTSQPYLVPGEGQFFIAAIKSCYKFGSGIARAASFVVTLPRLGVLARDGAVQGSKRLVISSILFLLCWTHGCALILDVL